MTDAEKHILFDYHPPTPETTPIYDRIRNAEAAFVAEIERIEAELKVDVAADQAHRDATTDHAKTNPGYYARVNHVAREFADACDETRGGLGEVAGQWPIVYYREGVIALALARNAANEAIATRQGVGRLMAMARTKAQEARWLLCGAVAIEHAVAEEARRSGSKPEHQRPDWAKEG